MDDSTEESGRDISDIEYGRGGSKRAHVIDSRVTRVRIRSDSVTSVHSPRDVDGKRFWAPEPIYEGSKHIRVLSIEPARTADDSLSCHLHFTSLDNPSHYLALSYAWGKRPPTFAIQNDNDAIQVSESTIDVGSTLHGALLRIREYWDNGGLYFGAKRPKLWVDALCINQSDEAEKSAQVAMMGEIFSKARSVLIWLGEPRRHPQRRTSKGEELLQEMHTSPVEPNDLTRDLMRLRHDPLSDLNVRDRLHDAFGLYEKPLAKLAKLPWFSRRWVVQEIVLQPNRYILLGSRCLLFSKFLSLASCEYSLPGIYSDSNTESRSRSNSLPKNWCWQPHILEQKTNLLTNMVVFRHHQCSKEVDLVYALRAISTDGDDFLVDYTKTPAQVYLEFASIYARTTWLPSLLIAATGFRAWAETARRDDKNERLPSWVPDWRESEFKPVISGFAAESMEAYLSGRRRDSCSFSRLSIPMVESVESTAKGLILECWTSLNCTHLWHIPSCLHCFVCLKARSLESPGQHWTKTTVYCLLDDCNVLFAFSSIPDPRSGGTGIDTSLSSYKLMFFLGIKYVTKEPEPHFADSSLFNFFLEVDDFEVTRLPMRRTRIRVL